MVKLTALIDCVARELATDRRTINVLAMELRKAGLIRSTGRSLHAADMEPSDATNLLLAVLGGGYMNKANERVRDLRRSGPHKWLKSDADGIRYIPDGPDLPFVQRLSPDHTLGDMLDSLFAEYGAQSSFQDDQLSTDTFKLTINRSATFSLVKLQFGTDAGLFELSYFDVSGGEFEYRIRRSRHREITERIAGSAFAAIGACLSDRDYVPQHPAEFLDTLARAEG